MTEEEYLNLAGEYFAKKDFKKANEILEKALSSYPKSGELHYNLGLILSINSQYKEAIKTYQTALKFSPKFELAWLNLGVTYIRFGQVDKGIDSFRKLIKVNRHSFPAYYNLGLALQKISQLIEASKMFDEAIKINPNNAELFFKAGLLNFNMGKLQKSMQYFRKCVEISPNYARAQGSLGEIYEKIGKYDKAKIAFHKALKLDPKILPDIVISLYYLAKKTCDWKNVEYYSKKINNMTLNGLLGNDSTIEPPFTSIERTDDIKLNFEVARYWSSAMEESIKIKPHFQFSKKPKKKIRIGYLSADVRDHPVTNQIVDLFRYHNKKKFEIYAYSYGGKDHGPLYKTVKEKSDLFRDLTEMEHPDIAKMIFHDKIDILIDLMGYTGDQRPDITVYKPAPIQVGYLGHPGTTGSKYIDYLITDKITVPENERKYYSEKIKYLPNCYQICSPPEVSRKMYKKSDFDLPDKGIIFGSFNRVEKIERHIFDTWIKILKRVPDSILWLYTYTDNKLANDNLINYFVKSGLNKKRLIFAYKLPMKEHIARLRLVDIGLDTHIYSGGATTANLLWAGIPLVTLYGKHFLSRMSSSILSNIGLSKLVAKNLSEYENIAVNLAINPEKLSKLKQTIEINKKTYPLFDSRRFTKDFENIFETIWDEYKTTLLVR